jgi:hypothetical protein
MFFLHAVQGEHWTPHHRGEPPTTSAVAATAMLLLPLVPGLLRGGGRGRGGSGGV